MLDVNKTEKEIIEFWEKNKTFEKSLAKTKKGKPYVFYDGPPFATGLPHYGHILASVLKDAIPRFWTMKGRHVRRVWGWDCHGLPIENIAEKELGLKSKDEIEKLSVKKFNDFCRGKVLTYASEWKKTVKRIARWTEFDGSYKTMDNDYIESVWWALKKMHEMKLLYEGEKILMYCIRCATPLSKSEIAMDNSYKNRKDETVTVKFKLEDGSYALAWTTTPWTLPSNLALAVKPDLDYAYAKDKKTKEVYVLAEETLGRYFKNEKEYEILKKAKGKKLTGMKYEPLFPYFKNLKNSFRIVSGDYVDSEEGTGIVHMAPAFGEEDYNTCKENGIDLVQPVDAQGRFTSEAKDFEGEKIFDANPKIIEKLKKENKLVKVEKVEHEYPYCYRCETPLIYRAVPSWFVNIQKVKKKLIQLNKKINWYPDFLKDGRVKHNLETAPDWNISRNRYWATALPIWKCPACGEIKILGSVAELKKNAVKLPFGEIDLHKDYLDKVKLKCSCGKEMSRIPEVLDCWFESGSMPFAQFHYPFENKDTFKKNFPSQFVSEYIGQTRAWFYYMMVVAAILFEEIPFENVLTTGTILAEDGTKMSKSKRNFPDPWLIFEKFGVDTLRFYLLSSSVMNADNFNFSEKGVEEIYKRLILILYNVNEFYSNYSNKNKISKSNSKELSDKWIISRLNEFIEAVNSNMENYNTIKSCAAIKEFADDLSTWYIRINRERFNEEDKDAIETLGFVLDSFAKTIAPIMPFVSEKIYQNVNKTNNSVHLENWPKSGKADFNLINRMKLVQEIVSKGLMERDKAQIGLKWPLQKATIIGGDYKLKKNEEEIIKSQLNVKEIFYRESHANTKDISVDLDTKITPELEAEGYARELSRQVQAFRKKLGLVKKDKIGLKIFTDDELGKILKTQEENLKMKTNSKKLEIYSENVTTRKEKFKNNIEFKIKDKRGNIVIIR